MKKRACELTPGDIIIMSMWQRVVLNTKRVSGGVALTVASMGDGFSVSPPEVYAPNHEFAVKRTDLTPAQHHAEELLAAARAYLPMLEERCGMYQGPAAVDKDPKVIALRTLLKRIDPPIPPTAQELAASLAKITAAAPGHVDLNDAMTLLARARQAGML